VTTDELDAAADRFIREQRGVPTSEGYKGFPKAICISPNDVVVHGIPGQYQVAEGDLVTIDVGVTLDGYIADSAYTFAVGEIDSEAQRLLDVAQDALAAGIAEARHENRVGDIAHAVQTVVEDAGFSVVRSLVGHGVGRYYHEDPHIPNFGEPGRGPRLSDGMTIAIEPMITAGGPDISIADDGWTISTADGSLAAHFEHTVAITADGPRILTPRIGVPANGVEV
nr:type I methionyl aminopeptidase [Actinomycetota bacterium]